MSNKRGKSESNPRSAGIDDDIEARPMNWLVPAVLVLLREHGSYGYELMERMVELGFATTNPGSLYRVLRKMETEGLCESEWDTASSRGPARRMYSLTIEGEAYLDLWVQSLQQYQKSMSTFVQAYRSGTLDSF